MVYFPKPLEQGYSERHGSACYFDGLWKDLAPSVEPGRLYVPLFCSHSFAVLYTNFLRSFVAPGSPWLVKKGSF